MPPEARRTLEAERQVVAQPGSSRLGLGLVPLPGRRPQALEADADGAVNVGVGPRLGSLNCSVLPQFPHVYHRTVELYVLQRSILV